MFVTYYSNQLEIQKDILVSLLENLPQHDPFQSDIVLVQSPGMAQWLQMEIAKKRGVAANFQFPMPSSFIWKLYADNLPNVSTQNPFEKDSTLWRLMRLIPTFLQQKEFEPLKKYLASSPASEQQKLYQLSLKVADLFDQYLVYRPEWIAAWEENNDEKILAQINQQKQGLSALNPTFLSQIKGNIHWQGILWRALVDDVQRDFGGKVKHRAALNQQFLALCRDPNATLNLPERIFIFGIPALPTVYLNIFQGISAKTDVHLFFNNPCQEYWGDLRDLSKSYLLERQRFVKESDDVKPLISAEQVSWEPADLDYTNQQEELFSGNPLLASWGKMGRDFLYQLVRDEENIQAISRDYYAELPEKTLLGQIQNQILTLSHGALNIAKNDRSLVVKSCHSAMREVEVLHDYLLDLFNQNQHKPKDEQITPKDVVVMVADVNQYTPYIQAVFGANSADAPVIPFSISDSKLSESDVIVSSYLSLLNLRESQFGAEEVLALLDIPAIRERFNIALADLEQIREWVKESGIRFGLEKLQNTLNFNAWQAGLERMTLGYAMREEQGVWQDSLGLDSSYGLKGQLVGAVNQFFTALNKWHQDLQKAHNIEKWREKLTALLTDFFVQNEETADTLFYIQDCINAFADDLQTVNFEETLQADVIAEVMSARLEETPNSLRFLAGKVNFCTLLPMRSIPFKVVCLLGMNEADYPRSHTPNSFDLMQYHHQKGDRVRRDDDRYLFLEALLAARSHFYVSYVGCSIIDNQPKEPSVLVSQLIDYINHYSENSLRIEQHPMTAFSPSNFQHEGKINRSFAKKWLPIAQFQERKCHEFVVPMGENQEPITEIELDRFVSFVENPVKFFFEKQLGVYFRDEDDRIEESENFTLNGLDHYRISNELLHLEEAQFNDYFAKQRVKGIMPRGEFAEVCAQSIRADVLAFKEKIKDYSSPHSESVDFVVETAQGNIRLFGYMEPLFGDENQIIEWRFAKYKDRYRIRPWLYYLIQLATKENALPPRIIAKDKDLTLKTIEKSTALEKLKMYVEAYLQSQQQIQLIPTENIAKFIEKDESAVNFDNVLTNIESLAKDDNYGYRKVDPYWARVLGQTEQFKSQDGLLQLVKQTTSWFGEMLS